MRSCAFSSEKNSHGKILSNQLSNKYGQVYELYDFVKS